MLFLNARHCLKLLTLAILGLTILGLASTGVSAGEIRKLDITNNGNRYQIDSDVIINAPVAQVRAVLTNYAQLHRINNSVKAVDILSTQPKSGTTRTKSTVHMCALFFCMELHQVQDMIDVKPGDLRAFIINDTQSGISSDFSSGRSYWKTAAVEDNPNQTRLLWFAEVTPSFWIPPAIGPWVIKSKMEEEALETIEGIEAVIQIDFQNTPK